MLKRQGTITIAQDRVFSSALRHAIERFLDANYLDPDRALVDADYAELSDAAPQEVVCLREDVVCAPEYLGAAAVDEVATSEDFEGPEALDADEPEGPFPGAARDYGAAFDELAAARDGGGEGIAFAPAPTSAPSASFGFAGSAPASASRPSALGSLGAGKHMVHAAAAEPHGLRSWLDQVDEPFSTTLLALIDRKGLSDAQVYKRAHMSRQLFSRIRSDADYRPAKKTVLALAIALELNLAEMRDLLERAGFALSRSSKRDVIVEYYVTNGIYDLFAINDALYEFDQPLI